MSADSAAPVTKKRYTTTDAGQRLLETAGDAEYEWLLERILAIEAEAAAAAISAREGPAERASVVRPSVPSVPTTSGIDGSGLSAGGTDDSGLCEVCGGSIVPLAWHVPDELWATVMGKADGLTCIRCFTLRAALVGLDLDWLGDRFDLADPATWRIARAEQPGIASPADRLIHGHGINAGLSTTVPTFSPPATRPIEAEAAAAAVSAREGELRAALERERDLRQALLEGSYFHVTHDDKPRHPTTCGDCRRLAETNAAIGALRGIGTGR